MATYSELRGLFAENQLRNKVEVACIVAAEAIRGEDSNTANHANRLIWAKAAFTSPRTISTQMLMALLAANSAASVEEIIGATDDQIQSKVDVAINIFADGS